MPLMSDPEKVDTLEQLLDLADSELTAESARSRVLEATVEELEAAVESAQYTSGMWKSRALNAEKERQSVESMLDRIQCLRSIPESLVAALDAAESFFDGSIVISPEARKDADAISDCSASRLWEAMFDMGTVLPQLVFGDEATNDFCKAFHDRTGFELAMTETGTTKNQSRMMAERSLVFEGVEYDITPHLKLVRGGSRVYFAIDRDDSRFIVGRIGHLTTAGTRRNAR